MNAIFYVLRTGMPWRDLTREQMRVDLEELWLSSRKTVLFITHSIDEAILLSDRVIVMSPRPGGIDKVFDVDTPRPRGLDGRGHTNFEKLNRRITSIFLQRGVLRAGGGFASGFGRLG